MLTLFDLPISWPESASAQSTLFLALVLRDSRLHQLSYEGGGQRLVHGELDSAFGCLEVLEFILERHDDGRTHRKQTAMVGERAETQQRSFVLERRHSIANGLRGLRWHNRPNRRTNLVQSAAGGFRDACRSEEHTSELQSPMY